MCNRFQPFWCPAGSATELRLPIREESFEGSGPLPAIAALESQSGQLHIGALNGRC